MDVYLAALDLSLDRLKYPVFPHGAGGGKDEREAQDVGDEAGGDQKRPANQQKCAVGDLIYLPDEAGLVHIFRAPREGYEPVATNHLNDGGMASPVIVDGRLYLRTNHRLYCIGEK